MPAYMKGNTLFQPSTIKTQTNYVPWGREVCIPVPPYPLSVKPYLTHPAAAKMPPLLVGKTGIATLHTVNKLWDSTLSFQLLDEVNEQTKVDDSKIIMMNLHAVYLY